MRASIAEDYDLARIVKRDARFRSMLVDANDLVYTRMYRSLREIWAGFSKNLYLGVREHPLQPLFAMGMLAAVSPLPEILLVCALGKRQYMRAALMAACIGVTAGAAEFGMRGSRFPRGSGAFFPLGASVMLAILVNSAVQHRTGRVRWRGRRYGGARQTPGPLWNRPASR